MRREPVGYQDPEISIALQASDHEVGESGGSRLRWSFAGVVMVGLAVAAFLGQSQEPAEPEPRATDALPLAVPATTVVTTATGPLMAFELTGSFNWIEVLGLEPFESITAPIPFAEGHIVIGNPSGISASAAVMFSEDGSDWEHLGTVTGIGGEVEIIDLEVLQGRLLALGTFTETMPLGESQPRRRHGSVWTSSDGTIWEMVPLAGSRERVVTPGSLVVGEAGVLVNGWSDSDYGEPERFEALPTVYQEEIARGSMYLTQNDADDIVVVAPGNIEVFRAAGLPTPQNDGWSPEFYLSADGHSWEQVTGPALAGGGESFVTGPNGEFIAARQGAPASVSHDGISWEVVPEMYLAGWTARGPSGLTVAMSWEGSALYTWSHGGSKTIRLNQLALVPHRLREIAAGPTNMAILRHESEGVSSEPDSHWVEAGDYEITAEYGATPYLIARNPNGGTEIGRWQLWNGLNGVFDPETRTVTLDAEDGTRVELPLDSLREMLEGEVHYSESEFDLLISIDGITWVSDRLPGVGVSSLVGAIDGGFLVRTISSSGKTEYMLARQ
ncbi:MAG TPA: hypothetical protein VM470_08005 [Acidimicrobiia bacterium]|nr:hypothetical protein [Acidimicrobiia bacterium]